MKVIVYTSPTCQSCAMIEEYLSSHGIKYEKVDVTKDKEALERLVEKTGKMFTPVIEISDQTVVGFNKPEIDRLLGLYKEDA